MNTLPKLLYTLQVLPIQIMDSWFRSIQLLIRQFEWKNEFINWDPESYCSIKSVFLTGDNFWKPDLYINEMTDNNNKPPVIAYYNLDSTGEVIYSVPMQIVSSCALNIFMFPFDTQTCKLTFGSYNYPASDIIMFSRADSWQVFDNTLEFYVTKGDWSLLNMVVVNDSTTIGGKVYSTVHFEGSLLCTQCSLPSQASAMHEPEWNSSDSETNLLELDEAELEVDEDNSLSPGVDALIYAIREVLNIQDKEAEPEN
ncbi:5-hydroxytryptamine receptor 3C-like [Pseudophryne corroboree]|uniref:5-hydroxytryptamine receptor 3C-like n=1 Tax=Pseudophryne corroboree TaxID=495146 RepID=UPI00308180FC